MWTGRSRDGQKRAVLSGPEGSVTALAIAPDGSWLAVGSSDGKVRICDVATGKQRVTLADSHHGDTDKIEVAVAPEGSWLAVSGEDGKVRICDVATGKLRAALAGPPVWATAVAVAPDGSWL